MCLFGSDLDVANYDAAVTAAQREVTTVLLVSLFIHSCNWIGEEYTTQEKQQFLCSLTLSFSTISLLEEMTAIEEWLHARHLLLKTELDSFSK